MSRLNNFPKDVKDTLAKRVAYRCSYPNCSIPTVGPSLSDNSKSSLTGQAAHIYAASPKGPRAKEGMTKEEINSIENGIWLCDKHAHEIDIDTNLYTPEMLKAWKEKAENQANWHRKNGGLLPDMSKLILASKNAYIALELEKIKRRYFQSDRKTQYEILEELYMYHEHVYNETAFDILSFLERVAQATRLGISHNFLLSLVNLTMTYFPIINNIDDINDEIQAGSIAINIAYCISYDAVIKLNLLSVLQYGLMLLKYIYVQAKHLKCQTLIDNVEKSYDDLKETIQERHDSTFNNALRLIKIFESNLEVDNDISFPLYESNLHDIIDKEKYK